MRHRNGGPHRRLPALEQFERHIVHRPAVHVAGTDADTRAMAEALAQSIEGEVRFAPGDRALYSADAGNYRQVPIGVVIPRTIEDVVHTVRIAREHGAPVLPRGAGTSLAGQSVNTAVVIDFTKYLDQILELDVSNARARLQPGVVLDVLRDRAEQEGLTFGPDTSTHEYNSVGGMIGNNSCGVRSLLSQFRGPGSRTSDHVHELDLLLYDGTRLRVGRTGKAELERIISDGGRRGEIYRGLREIRDQYASQIRERYPRIPRRVSGYNLDELLPENGFHVARALAGSEGTCAIILEATLLLVENPPVRSLVILGFESVYEAGDHVPEILAHEPTGLEAVDDRLVDNLRRKGLGVDDLSVLPDGRGWLLVEFGGKDQEEVNAYTGNLADAVRRLAKPPSVRVLDSPEDQHRAWHIRESGLGATAFVPGERDRWPGWEDSAVPPERVGEYLRDLNGLYEKYGYSASLYGHIGEGVVHTRTDFDLYTARGIDAFRSFTQEAAEMLTRKYGGSLSGEHGDGQARGDLLATMYGEELVQAFREFKSVWDPEWRMNPGKVVNPRPRDADLRLGADYRPVEPDTHFQFPEDGGSFARAALRCVGVGKCRRTASGTMCPSYQVLREEMHTTRGRAHALFEMLEGDTIKGGWRSEPVKEALDLCLSCKGCKGECPVNVDIATYKAEFLSHYYRGHLRPRQAYAFGLIQWWSRLASLAPAAVNVLTQTRGLDRLAKWAAGVARERRIPEFAGHTFRDWWARRNKRQTSQASGPRVILWPDTFNNYFHPSTLQAATEVLEGAGCEVIVPSQWLCCGRPLYEYGMLDLAKWQLRQILNSLGPEIRAGTPVVGLEPSCTAVFRDELGNLMPNDLDARRLAEQTFTLGEFLAARLDDYTPPRLEGTAVLHGHCHHKAIMGLSAEERLLRAMGLGLEVPDTGCCGMAGAFGFEAGEKYEISLARGEQALLPAVRRAGHGALIIADGFSCREQIVQATDRRPLHTAEVLQMASRQRTASPSVPPEEQQEALKDPALAQPTSALAGAAVVGAVVGGSLLAGGLAARRFARARGRSRLERCERRWPG